MSGETERNVSGWTTDTLHAHMQRQIDDLRAMLQERYETQTKAIDAAFVANQTAMQTALTAAERAVTAAAASAEKAVLKAEGAAEKRFEAVNEFRGQLADQQATFMPRELADSKIATLAAAGEARARGLDEHIQALQSRLDSGEGSRDGSLSQRNADRLDRSAIAATGGTAAANRQVLIATVVAVIAFLGLVITVVAFVVHG